ncbi:MAG: hypothetical protein HN856_04805 [Gammaproteobacteria bacterium]|nr:hypothetical protein [Gammaproteobacteria bacterium]
MTRKTLIQLHLIAAAFFTPVLLLIACSGGLYLLGYKGNVHSTPVSIPQGISIDINSTDLDATVRKLLQRLNQPSDFEYVKQKGATLFTRPTSKTHYEIRTAEASLQVLINRPNLQKTLIELHKGHGPLSFKTFQKFTAIALLFILLTGTWLGLSAAGLRRNTSLGLAAGAILPLLLILAS